MSGVTVRRLCHVCTKASAKYVCPQCNVPYCSALCFKAHGASCTEKFFKAQVMGQLKVTEETLHENKVMEDILRRQAGLAEDSNSDAMHGPGTGLNDVEEQQALVQKLEKLALQSQILPHDLTEAQRAAFMRAVAGGELSTHISIWNPWWIKDLTSEKRKSTGIASKDQHICTDPVKEMAIEKFSLQIIEMHRLCPLRKTFPVQLRFNLVDILCSYVFTVRLFNGDMDFLDPLGSTNALINHSATFSRDHKFQSTADAFKKFESQIFGGGAKRVANTDVKLMKKQMFLVVVDVAKLIHKKEFIMKASDAFCKYIYRSHSLIRLQLDKMKRKKARPISNSFTSNVNVHLDQDNNIQQYMTQWIEHLHNTGAISNLLSFSGVAKSVSREDRPRLKRICRRFSLLKKKAMFFASWVRILTPIQLKILQSEVESFMNKASGVDGNDYDVLPQTISNIVKESSSVKFSRQPKNFVIDNNDT